MLKNKFEKKRDEKRNKTSGVSGGDGKARQAPKIDWFLDGFLDVFRIKSLKFLLVFC